MAAPNILNVNQASQEKLLKYLMACYEIRDEGWQLRNRLEEADRAYLRESDYSEETRKAQLAAKNGDKTKLQNIQVPVVMESVENTVGFLSNVYLTDYPMFKFVADPEKQDLALMWNTLVGEDQIRFGWAGELNIGFRCGSKYNVAPMEVEWCREIKYKAVNSGNGGQKLEQLMWEGNRITSIDPYNLIYDPRVPIHKVHEEGEFVGYVKPLSRIALKRFLASLGEERLKNDKKAFEAGDWGVQYYIPQINRSVMIKNNNWLQGTFNWTRWAMDRAQAHIDYRDMYTMVKLYARIMPFEFGINAPRDQTPDIWKLIAVNGVLVYAQPETAAHDYLPIVIAQPRVDNLGHQTKAQAENVAPFQEMISSLWNARLADSRRRVMDRMIYNPLLIDPEHINSPNPAAKIPLRPTAYGRKMEDAVYPIPYHGENSQQFISDAQGIGEWAMRVDGRNRVSLGQFQKGNKLNDEYHDTMANAGIQDRTQALMWETYTFTPIKVMLRSNYLQYTPEGVRYNRVEEKSVNIDPIELRKAAAEFEVGDGLLPAQRLARTDVMQHFMQYLGGQPGIQNRYEIGPMTSYIMKVQGVDKLSKFEKTAETVQYEQALATWQAVMAEYRHVLGKPKGTPDGAVWAPEDIQKMVGPMPQPPQPQGTKNAVAST